MRKDFSDNQGYRPGNLDDSALRESEEKFSKIFHNNPSAMVISRFSDGLIVDFNESFIDLVGYSRKEILGGKYTTLQLYNNIEDREKILQVILTQGNVRNYEVAGVSRTGQERSLLISSEIIIIRNEKFLISTLVDITAKKESDEALKESEERFSKVFQNNPAAIIINTIEDGRIIRANNKVSEIFGYSQEELNEKNFSTRKLYLNGADRDKMLKLLLRDGKVNDFETRGITKDGRIINILISTEIFNVRDQKYLVGSLLDITATKIAEEERDSTLKTLIESEERFSKIFHSNPAAISLSKLSDGTMVDVNESFLKIFGYKREELIGKQATVLGMYSNPKDRDFITESLAEKGEIINHEITAFTKKKEKVFLNLSAVKISYKSEDHILFATIDITESKKLEKELAYSEERYSTIFHESPVAIVLTEMPSRRVAMINDTFISLFGFEKNEVIGRTITDLNIADFSSQSKLIREINEKGFIKDHEVHRRKKDGTILTLLLNIKWVTFSGEKYLMTTVADITERRKMETTLRAMQKSSQLIAHVTDEKEFLNQVCNIIIDDCGYSMIWIGLKTDDERKTVLPVAYAGPEKDYINTLDVTWSDTPEGNGPTGRAIKSGKTIVINNINEEPSYLPWRQEGIRRGFASAIVVPLFLDEEVYGVMVIYSSEENSFSEDEKNLLMKMADDVSYGVKAIKMNMALKQAKENLEIKVEERTALLKKTMSDLDNERRRVTDVLNMIPAYVIVIDHDHRITFANSYYTKEFGSHENNGHEFPDKGKIRMVFKTRQPYHWEWKAPNGRIYDVSDFLFNDSEGKELILEMGLDVTEKKDIEHYVLRKIVETEERDRRQFASDLHDDLGPTLSAIKLQLSLLSTEVSTDSKRELLSICDNLLSEGIEKMRSVANSIMPNILESYGLETAVKSFLNKVMKDTHIDFEIASNMDGQRFDKETELHLYRIVTELITNTIKHSGATKIDLKMKIRDGIFTMLYCDNGKGYTFNSDPHKVDGVGLQNIQNRVKLIDGKLNIATCDGKTIVRMTKDF